MTKNTGLKSKEKCFIIMPITTPQDFVGIYKDDGDHFKHVLDCLFLPAVEKAGFEPIPPKSTGSEIIQAEIIKHLSTSELVLCDMSILNPNVFFEFGIRTALNKPVALVGDDKVKIPFDTSIINFHKYSGALNPWEMDKEKEELSEHIKTAYEKGKDYNALWKYFGVAQTGVFKPEQSSLAEKVDFLINEITALKKQSAESNTKTEGDFSIPPVMTYYGALAEMERRQALQKEMERRQALQKEVERLVARQAEMKHLESLNEEIKRLKAFQEEAERREKLK